MPVQSFTDEQARALINLRQRYEGWIDAEQTLAAMPYDLRRKQVAGRTYLYEIDSRDGNGKSLGAWSPDNEALFNGYHARKTDAKERRDRSKPLLDEAARLARASRVPLVASEAGPILREADRRGLLRNTLLVIGTNAIAAYALEAGGFILDLPSETADIDLAWAQADTGEGEQVLWRMFKAVDPTFSVNAERTFQVRNAKAYEAEILVAPSRAGTVAATDRPRPLELPEQEWLLEGRAVDHVLVCRDASPVRIVAPDPRWFGLHKLWLAEQRKRAALKRVKDAKQGRLLLDAVAEAMPAYPLDTAFRLELPVDLAPIYDRWAATRPLPRPPTW